MRLQILLASVALISTLCSACSGSKSCLSGAFAEIAVSYAATGQSNQAIQVAQRMNKSIIKVEVLSQIAFQTAKAGEALQAAVIFNQALQEANKLESPPDKVMAKDVIATKYGKLGQKDKATELLSQAVRDADEIWGTSFVKDTVLEKIAVSYVKLGDYGRGIQVTNKIVEDIPKGRALARIVAQYVAAGKYDQARQVANTIEVQTSLANALIEIAAKTGEYQQVLAAAEKIDEEGSEQLKSIILGKIALLYAKNGQEKQAAELLDQALQAVKTIEDRYSQVYNLTKVALWYAEVGKKQQAVAVSSQALEVGSQIPDQATKAVLFAKVAVLYGQAGRKDLATSVFAQAIKMAQSLDQEDSKARTLAEVAIASAKINPYNQVLALTQNIGDTNNQSYALIQLAKNYAQAGYKQESLQALKQAFGMVETAKNSQEKAQRLTDIVFQLNKISQYNSEALLQVNRAIAIVQTIDVTEKNSPKASILAKIANLYVKQGEHEKAITILSQALEAAKVTKCSY